MSFQVLIGSAAGTWQEPSAQQSTLLLVFLISMIEPATVGHTLRSCVTHGSPAFREPCSMPPRWRLVRGEHLHCPGPIASDDFRRASCALFEGLQRHGCAIILLPIATQAVLFDCRCVVLLV